MKRLLLVAVAALLAVPAATANNGKAKYSFLGKLTATPANGGISIEVEGGNKLALKKMLGAPVAQTFSYGANTEFLKWSNGIPSVVQASDLAAGDYVRIHVRAPGDADLDEIEDVDAGIVGDHGPTLYKPDEPLYLFRGKLTATAAGSVSVQVMGGNKRALRLLVGESGTQTFTVGDATIYLLWQGKVPSVIDHSKLTIGDRVVVRIRAAAGSSLAEVTATAAVKVAEHEPASSR